MSNFDEWEKEFLKGLMEYPTDGWGNTDMTVGENRALLKTMLQMDDTQQICNFVIIAQVHDNGQHCTAIPHRGVIVTSLESEDVISFVNAALEQL